MATLSENSRYYILGAFLLGVALTTAYNIQFAHRISGETSAKQEPSDSELSKSKSRKLDALRKSISQIEKSLRIDAGTIKEGIEGCIGNTPLIKIKSLSDYTGCEILAKAEVID